MPPLFDTVISEWNAFIGILDAHAGAITAAATVAIAALTYALAKSTKRLWKATKQSADAIAKLERSSVFPFVNQMSVIAPLKEFEVKIMFENHGRIAARVKEILFKIDVFQGYPTGYREFIHARTSGIVPVTTKPSAPEFGLSTKVAVSTADMTDVFDGKRKLLCFGIIKYFDVIGEWETGWCWEYMPTGDFAGFRISANDELNYHV